MAHLKIADCDAELAAQVASPGARVTIQFMLLCLHASHCSSPIASQKKRARNFFYFRVAGVLQIGSP